MKIEYAELLFVLDNGNKAKVVFEPGVSRSWFINGKVVYDPASLKWLDSKFKNKMNDLFGGLA